MAIWSILALAAGLGAAAPPQPAASPKFEARPCAGPTVPRVQCGIVSVPENRAAPAGRRIDLNVIVLKSDGPVRLPPLFDLEGGPGLPSTRNIGFYADYGASKGRDVVMVDQRGTGKSNPLLCPALQTAPSVPMLPLEEVKACRAALSRTADLRFYGTRDAVRDLDDVRRALGYDKIDLSGLSYGTTVALRYMQRYPDNVRAALLMGVAPPDFLPPQHHATAAQHVFDTVFAQCAADTACNKANPDLADALAEARRRSHLPGATVTDEVLMERLRTLTYRPASRARLPLLVRRAAAGDLSELFAKPPENLANYIADGMFLAITCGESFPLMNESAMSAAARRTPFGDYRLRRQKAACAGWPEVERDPDHLAPPTGSSAVVLLVSGELDPVTPPEFAEKVKAQLRHARHVVVPGGGHIPDGVSGVDTCLDPLMVAFLDQADLSRLDTSCVAGMKGPAYTVQ